MTQKTYLNASGEPISRQRAEQLRHPERLRARQAVFDAIIGRRLSRPSGASCIDCGKSAQEYDHHLGYALEHQLHVEPVCRRCHYTREMLRRGSCRRGHPYTLETTMLLADGRRQCRECRNFREARVRQPHGAHEDGPGSHHTVYLPGSSEDLIDGLIEAGYAPNISRAIRRALVEAAARIRQVAA